MKLCNCRKPAAKDGEGVELGPGGQAPEHGAKRQLLEESLGRGFEKPESRRSPCAQRCRGALKCLGLSIRSQILHFGEDWVFLFLLGITMATLSFGLDLTISKCQQANLWVYDELAGYPYLQYLSWVLYHVLLMMVSAAAAKYVSPQAAGSGIPELKVALRGVVLHEFFTFRTFVAKLVGVMCTLAAGSTIFLGKVGPFVHMATILALLLGKAMVKFVRSTENPGRKYELLVAGSAVGVACCFVAPVGGVLFGVEATGTHFAVHDYWRGFFAATCAALAFRLLAVLNDTKETVAVLFHTSWHVEFPYDLPELFSYAILGALCGGLCCVFLFCHRNILAFLNRGPKIKRLTVNNKILHAGLVSFILASITFPQGSGQYLGARFSMKELLEIFFSNGSWSLGEAAVHPNSSHPIDDDDIQWLHRAHLSLSPLEMVSLFLLAKFFMVLLATSMMVPAGFFLPVFVYGAALGRLYGEALAKIFPGGLVSEGVRMHITPAGYALAGAAAYSGAVTQTLSAALLTFELTGQMSHILPVLLAVLVANAISQRAQPSFFEGIIIVKRLPFLPKLSVGKSRGHDFYTEDFMVTDLRYLSLESKYKDLWRLLKTSNLKQFPLVDSQESCILLGSIRRKHLTRLLSEQLSAERRFHYLLRRSEEEAAIKSPEEAQEGLQERKLEESETAQGAAPHPASPEGDLPKAAEGEKTSQSNPWSTTSPSSQKEHLRSRDLVEEWECQQLQETVRLDGFPVDPAPYRLMEKETLYQCYDLFNLLGLRMAYVTSHRGRLVGVVALKELKAAIEACVGGTSSPEPQRQPHKPEGQKTSEEDKVTSSLRWK